MLRNNNQKASIFPFARFKTFAFQSHLERDLSCFTFWISNIEQGISNSRSFLKQYSSLRYSAVPCSAVLRFKINKILYILACPPIFLKVILLDQVFSFPCSSVGMHTKPKVKKKTLIYNIKLYIMCFMRDWSNQKNQNFLSRF